MPGVLFDTSVYIHGLRTSDQAALSARHIAASSAVWLSAVVLEELYAGATRRSIRIIEKLEHDFEKARRILVPNQSDWTSAGKVLARLAVEHGYEAIGQSRITNDALLAMSAARGGLTLITANERDFTRLSKFRSFSWQIAAI